MRSMMRIDPDILHRAMAALEVQSEYVRGLEALDAPAIAEEYERQWAERVGCEPPDANCDGADAR
jgi:hypothetical protein